MNYPGLPNRHPGLGTQGFSRAGAFPALFVLMHARDRQQHVGSQQAHSYSGGDVVTAFFSDCVGYQNTSSRKARDNVRIARNMCFPFPNPSASELVCKVELAKDAIGQKNAWCPINRWPGRSKEFF
ncbi:MAG: hypothetical protein M3X11_06555 [Acidobacteriota bacterium]|nr:hypothetical protein [Acidobacteriota bacterium]